MSTPCLFDSYFLGGFECSTHRRRDGKRLDLIEATEHDRFAAQDYRRLAECGIRTVRDGLRWHLIETTPGTYDWSSFLPLLRAARDGGMQAIWDLCHYGWPDGLDIWSPAFVDRFACFVRAAAHVIRDETDDVPFYCPVNEISYWAWAGGEVGRFNPVAEGRGGALKRQLVRTAIAGIEAAREVDRRVRFVFAEPAINVISHNPAERDAAESYRRAQFEAFDMLSGRLAPELGGSEEHLDLIGLNFYSDNQWHLGGSTIPLGNHAYRPFRAMLGEAYGRYGRPILIAETGAEGTARPAWLHYVCAEVRAAVAAGVPVEGICLYPVVDYAGWDNERPCEVGLLSVPDASGQRRLDAPFAEELQRQQAIFAGLFEPVRRRAGRLAAAL